MAVRKIIMGNHIFRKAELATKEDRGIVIDLLDTLAANGQECIGIAANMIGFNKRIIAINMGAFNIAMINPTIVAKTGPYSTKEACMSLIGERKARRFREIEVEYLDTTFHEQRQKYTGFIAEIIQHEIDHCDGIVI